MMEKKKAGVSAAMLTAYAFLYTATLREAHQAASRAPAAAGLLPSYGNYAAIVFGFLGFPLLCRMMGERRAKRSPLWVAAGGFAAGAACLLLTRVSAAFPLLSPLTLLCMGYVGGVAYCRFATVLAGNGHMGTAAGCSFGAACFLQYVFQTMSDSTALLALAMLGALVALAWSFRRLREESGEEQEEPVPLKEPLRICLITVCLFSLLCFFDAELLRVTLRSGGDAAAPSYSWPRLLMIPTYVLFGWLGDWKKGRYLPIATICASLPALLTPILTTDFTLNLSLFYLSTGALFSYCNVTFWRLAPRTGKPGLWAVMPRVIDGVVTVALELGGLAALSPPAVIAVDLALLAAVIIGMALGGDLLLSAPSDLPSAAGTPPFDDAELFAGMAERYALSKREADVLKALVLTDHTQQEIAAELEISVSTVQHHITAIYRKTGADNRAGLHRLYRDAGIRE